MGNTKNRTLFWLSLTVVASIALFITLYHKKSATAPSSKTPNYSAIGDSVAAGMGLDTASDSSACDRTDESYPFIVAKALKMELHNYACSGATLENGVIGNQTVNNLAQPGQLDRVFTENKPKLITITIGANDIGWTKILGKCLTTDCGSADDTAAIDAILPFVTGNIHAALDRVRNNYLTDTPRVVLTGYYHVLSDASSPCTKIPGITTSEQTWWNNQTDKLNKTLAESISGYDFVSYASVEFIGHDLCGSNPFIQGLNERAPFHPNKAGQEAMATVVAQTYRNTIKN